MTSIRVRFAPSPTGDPHIGNIRTALFDYLFAKSTGSDFVLRIEDTDRARYVAGSIEKIFKSLTWLGIMPNEGVIWDQKKIIEKGEFGPYFQSKRLDLYQKYAGELIEKDAAYRCFCSTERLEQIHQEAIKNKKPPKYDGLCRHLPNQEVEKKITTGGQFVIRLKVPKNQQITFTDEIHGQIEFNSNLIDDQILIKSDGFPTYHLAVVVDDYLMQISHIIRGEEWISSTPKHILIYQALGWVAPSFVHLPMILGADKSKLSKRHGAKSVLEYRAEGYLAEALVNFLALLGWSPGEDKEIMSLDEMTKFFKIEDINKASPIFDLQKLNHFNGLYIRKLSASELADHLLDWASVESRLSGWTEDRHYFETALKTIQERMVTLADAEKNLEFYFEEPEYSAELLVSKKSNLKTTKKALEISLSSLSSLSSWTSADLEANLRNLAANLDLPAGQILWPIRVALTGLDKSPGAFEVLEALGKNKSLERIEKAIGLL